MPYNIEIMCLGEDRYELLERAAKGLNGVQSQFRFELTGMDLRAPGLAFKRNEYLSTDIWQFLENQRGVGAPRPFVIAFVARPLRSKKLANLFGSHRAENGLAAVTLSESAQYVKEDERYCRYYLVRYAMSFVNWTITSHDDDDKKDCYFHRKLNKRDILLSLNSANICDVCRNQLDNPPDESHVHRLSDNERNALAKMRELVSGDHPYSIIMKGGGVKGLALAGALLELEKYFVFDRHVGTSAGAIAAVLLAAGFKPAELRDLLEKKDFTEFLDAPFWKLPFNFLIKQGFYPGEVFRLWIGNLLSQKLGLLAEVRMKDLSRAVIYAARAGVGTLTFDSMGPRQETVASFAVRCSMSIPLVFSPTNIEGRRVFDGGLRENFPLKRFTDSFPGAPFIALYLGKPDNRNDRWFTADLLNIVVDGEERELVDMHPREVVIIDTSPIGTTDFRLTSEEKDFLITVGRASALKLLYRRKVDNGPTDEQVSQAHNEAEAKRSVVVRGRRIDRYFSLGLSIILVCLVVVFGYGW